MRAPVPGGEIDWRTTDLQRSVKNMVLVRWVGAPWALLQVITYVNEYPPGYEAWALALVGVLVVGNIAIDLVRRTEFGVRQVRGVALAGLALDIFVLSAFVWFYAFDQETAIWSILFIAPLEGAILFQLVGAVASWGAIAVLYIGRELWGSDLYRYELQVPSITFRMGIGGIIAIVAGLMARDIWRERTRLSHALEEIHRVDRMRAGLVSMLGHDVRSPLTVIRGVVETLLKREDRIGREDRLALLTSADRQARRLEKLATDLLDLARLDEGRLDLDTQDVDVAALISEALTYIESGNELTVDVEEGLTARGDPSRLEQVVINLATNALKHGAAPVSITGSSSDGRVVLEVSDRGQGIGEEEVEQLFLPFGHAKKAGSTGYGLAIVKALVEAHGGEVSYHQNEHGGACFRVLLPRA